MLVISTQLLGATEKEGDDDIIASRATSLLYVGTCLWGPERDPWTAPRLRNSTDHATREYYSGVDNLTASNGGAWTYFLKLSC